MFYTVRKFQNANFTVLHLASFGKASLVYAPYTFTDYFFFIASVVTRWHSEWQTRRHDPGFDPMKYSLVWPAFSATPKTFIDMALLITLLHRNEHTHSRFLFSFATESVIWDQYRLTILIRVIDILPLLFFNLPGELQCSFRLTQLITILG